MTPAEIAASYDRLAAHWDGEAFPRENGIEAHRRAMRFQTARDRALDAGCGSSGRIIDLMLAEGCICRHLEFDQFPEEHLCVIVQRREG